MHFTPAPLRLSWRLSLRYLALAAPLLLSPLAFGQTTPTPAPAPVDPQAQRIHIEDSRTVIDEVRVGGQTKSIDVQPKGGMPAYQVAPASGERSWKVLGF